MAALTAAEIQSVIDTWNDDTLPSTVKLLYDSWSNLRMPAINLAVQALNDDPTSGFTTPGGRGYHKSHKCRTLTMHGVAAAAGGPTPLPAELRSMILPASAAGDAVSERMRLLEEEVRESRATLVQQAVTMASLARQAAAMDAERDVTADYEIHTDVLKLIPKSFLEHGPLSKVERRSTSRNHQGVYPDGGWPNGLAMKESTRNSTDMQKAKKLTLPQYAVEVSKFLERNDYTSKMTGSTLSRILDMKQQLVENVAADPDAWYRADDVIAQLVVIEECCEGAFKFGLDQSVNMRLNVASRVDVAMGISHLRVDPLKKVKDDFISADTYKLVEKEAKEKQNLTWAKQGHFDGSRAGSQRFSGKPFSKSSGNGYKSKGGQGGYAPRSKGSKGGGGKGRGRGGRGRGRGRGKSDDEPSGGDP
jgi:hypothetical protein